MSKNSLTNKHVFITSDFNINSLDYSSNEHVKDFFDASFQNYFVPLINHPTMVTRKSATCTDHILTSSFIDSEIEAGIFKNDMSDHFPVFCNVKTNVSTNSDKTIIYKRIFNEESFDDFKYLLNHVGWNYIVNRDANESYNKLLMKFSELYDLAFPETKIEIKTKSLANKRTEKVLKKKAKTV